MKLIGFVGWSGAGKTTLLAKVIPALVRTGLTVSTIKHAHHAFDVDVPGKDSHTHRLAGATEVLISSRNRLALMRELRGESEWTLGQLLERIHPVDLVVVEGFKRDNHPKIEIHREANGKPLLYGTIPNVCAIATDRKLSEGSVPVLDINASEAIAEAALRFAEPAGTWMTARG